MTAPLPNPSIVFVPLDILTADELNQICQNVSYLAGLFPITTSQISNNAITSDKIAPNAVKFNNIDSATLQNWVPNYNQKSSLALDSNGKGTVMQTGWVVYHYFGYSINESHYMKIFVNGTLVFQHLQEARTAAGAASVYGDIMFPVSPGDVITQTGANQEHTAIFIPGKFA